LLLVVKAGAGVAEGEGKREREIGDALGKKTFVLIADSDL
jgi:hypothetical protein